MTNAPTEGHTPSGSDDPRDFNMQQEVMASREQTKFKSEFGRRTYLFHSFDCVFLSQL
jgi:hypothetical protein